ncbi:hypothetical protein BS50DRAFT_396650 [Corynespora cassiicola Philippines]|uniref:Uncharacterized protein n=1 Tax=Corynespora cassiicola Philippines TaxID=1448308 RepID=A0A2T2NKE5_CORCC|nr:hypothetical protein BS50DRAFT_396650 [Corynespora cassiicola Philippines]
MSSAGGEPLDSDSAALDQTSADYAMQAAVSLGISSSTDKIPKVSAHCPSASCKWPLYSTLAVCSSCSDISDKLKLKRRYVNDTMLPQVFALDISIPGVQSNELIRDHEVFELPNGLSIQKTEEREIRMVTKGSMNWTETVTAKDDPSNIWALTVLKRTIPDRDEFLATECILNYCVKNIVSSFEAGILRENSMRIEQKIIPGSVQPFDSSRPDVRPWSDLCADEKPDFAFDGGYNVSHTAARSISRHMERTFSDWESAYSQNWTKSWGTTGFYMQVYGTTHFRPDSMQEIYDSSNVTAMFEAIATSMTNNIRAKDDFHTVVHGTSSATVYQIRWNWLILPIINQVVGTFFLVFVIYYTKKYRVPLWKSSALAIMKCGSLTTALLDTAETLAEMETRAKRDRFTISRSKIKKQEKEDSASEQDDTFMGHELSRLSISLERQNLSLSNMITNELDYRWVAIDSENR